MPDGPIRTRINAGESALRENIATLANINPALSQISQQTGGPADIPANEIPSIGALANMQAIGQSTSQARSNQANALINSLPQYTKGYRAYLKWRYPSRYGGGSSNSVYPVVIGGGGNKTGGSNLQLPPLTNIPGS